MTDPQTTDPKTSARLADMGEPLSVLMRRQLDQAMRQLVQKEEALVRRMLHFWDMAWGRPVRFERAPGLEPLPRTWEDQCTVIFRSNIVGLGPPCELGAIAHLRVLASDHIGADGEPLPPPEPTLSDDALKAMMQ